MENSESEPASNVENVRDWFVEVCKCAPAMALSIATELVDVCGISVIEDFPVLYEMDPLWLDQLSSCRLPHLTKILINSNVEKIGKTPLRLLSVEDVAAVINSCFVEFPYGQNFIDNSINGFSLIYVDNVSKLKEFGIKHEIHAATLLTSINTWKRVGVPNDLLNFNKSAVKEEGVNASATPDQTTMTHVGASSASGSAGAAVPNTAPATTVGATSNNDNHAVEHSAHQDDNLLMEHECASVISVDAPSVEMVCVQHNSNALGAAGSTQEPIYITSSSAFSTSDDGHSTGAKDDTATHNPRDPSHEYVHENEDGCEGDELMNKELPRKRASRTIQTYVPRKFARTAVPSHALLASDISVGGRIGRSGADSGASPISPSIASPSSTAHTTPVAQRKDSTSAVSATAKPATKFTAKAVNNNDKEASLHFSSSEDEGESRGPSPCGSFGDHLADYEDQNRERFGPWGQVFGAQQATTSSGEKRQHTEEVSLLDEMELSVDNAIVAGAGATASKSAPSSTSETAAAALPHARERFVNAENERHSASSALSTHLTSDRHGAAEISEPTETYDANVTGSSGSGSGSSSESASGTYALRPNRRLKCAQYHNPASTASAVTPSSGGTKKAPAATRPFKSGQGREAAIVKKGLDALKTACNNILNSREDKVLAHAVTYIGVSASKPGRESIDYIVDSGAYRRLLHFVHFAQKLPTSFVYYVLRTVSLIVTRLDGIHEVLILLEGSTMKDILKLCMSRNDIVRQQALHLVSEIGVSPDNGLKQKVLKSGAVKVIIESYHDVGCFHAPKTVRRIQGQCATALYKLCSMSTPEQFHYFRPALPVMMDLLTSHTAAWDAVVEAAQAVTFLVVADHPEQIDVLMEHKIFDTLVAIFQDHNKNASIRWHASAFVWSVAKHCSNQQMRSLFKLMGILGQVCQLEDAHPHLRSAALNTMQVMLQRGEYIVQQFVYHRDAISARVMELLRAHEHPELVHGDEHNANCIIKYASFTLTNAAIGANKDQMLKLLDQGLYPLLLKIVQLQGEPEKEEEAKMKGILALTQVLDVCSEEVLAVQQRAERKNFNAPKAWEFIHNLLVEVVVPNPIPFVAQSSGVTTSDSSLAQRDSTAASAQAANVGGGVGDDSSDNDQGTGDSVADLGIDAGQAPAEVPPGGAVLRWSAELQDKAQVLVDAARALELFS